MPDKQNPPLPVTDSVTRRALEERLKAIVAQASETKYTALQGEAVPLMEEAAQIIQRLESM